MYVIGSCLGVGKALVCMWLFNFIRNIGWKMVISSIYILNTFFGKSVDYWYVGLIQGCLFSYPTLLAYVSIFISVICVFFCVFFFFLKSFSLEILYMSAMKQDQIYPHVTSYFPPTSFSVLPLPMAISTPCYPLSTPKSLSTPPYPNSVFFFE